MPVDSTATVVICCSWSQAISALRPSVWAGNSRGSTSAPTQAQWEKEPTSMPAAWRWISGSPLVYAGLGGAPAGEPGDVVAAADGPFVRACGVFWDAAVGPVPTCAMDRMVLRWL